MELDFVKPYHKKQSVCYTRPNYREARWERAVKVYTINQESRYLLVKGVQAIGASKELVELFALYGEIEEYRLLDEYPTEQFTEVYWIKYKKIQAARFGKRKLDNRSFFGGILHVCYAPEYETVGDTREKLNERRRLVARKCKEYFKIISSSPTSTSPTRHDSENSTTLPQKTNLCQANMSNANVNEFSYHNTPTILLPPPPPPRTPHTPPQTRHRDRSLPRIPSAHATLPIEIQNLSRAEVYGDDTRQTPTHTVCTDQAKKDRGDSSTDVGAPSTKKHIVWNTAHRVEESSKAYIYTKEPGAWDPRKQERTLERTEEENTLASTVINIREKLGKTMEPSQLTLGRTNKEITCPLQSIQHAHQQQQPVTKKQRKDDGRKRI